MPWICYLVIGIPISMIVMSLFVDSDSQEWKSPFGKEK